jgi:ferric-dicitrate binding protein FerR (iron transport regulator)
MLRLLALLALAAPMMAHASAVVQSFLGDVRVGGAPVAQDQRIFRGTSVITGIGSRVVLRFDDGQQVVLDQNTEFRLTDFQYSAGSPREDRSILDLVKGALRLVSGTIGRRSQGAFQLRTPQMTIGVRGTDFMVALVNPGYVNVLQGSVEATNAGGTVVFKQGVTGMALNSATLPGVVSGAQIPGAAVTAFTNLSNINLAAGAGAFGGQSGGASAAAGAAAVSKPLMGVIVFGAIAVGVAALVADEDDKQTTTTHH